MMAQTGFTAIDVETANADMASICQVGIAVYVGGKLSDEWVTLVDPKDFFDLINVSIHGIDKLAVKDAPTFSDISQELLDRLDDRIVVCHTHFDRTSINRAFDKQRNRHPRCKWLDSARVARRSWEEFTSRGYGLGAVCEFLGYEFQHHDALEDAKAAAHILHAAIENTGLDLQAWLSKVEDPIGPSSSSVGSTIPRDGNPEGALYGEVVVFTGELVIPRRKAADMAARVGCNVRSGVTKNTTLLVVGDQDITKLAGHTKSSKHRKAESLIAKGQPLRILRESDFREMIQVLTK